ncbi:hypothetical protein [Lentimicrobium sp.]|nr:hypothetical protein [Lentimicrobium sp.]
MNGYHFQGNNPEQDPQIRETAGNKHFQVTSAFRSSPEELFLT